MNAKATTFFRLLLQIFTPITIVIFICLASEMMYPYNYGITGKNAPIATLALLPGAILLVPLDIFFRLMFAKNIRKLWVREISILLTIFIAVWLVLLFI